MDAGDGELNVLSHSGFMHELTKTSVKVLKNYLVRRWMQENTARTRFTFSEKAFS